MVDRKYGFSLLNSDPHRYCIVLSNALKQVAAVSRINRDGTYAVEYQHPDINSKVKPRQNSTIQPAKTPFVILYISYGD